MSIISHSLHEFLYIYKVFPFLSCTSYFGNLVFVLEAFDSFLLVPKKHKRKNPLLKFSFGTWLFIRL